MMLICNRVVCYFICCIQYVLSEHFVKSFPQQAHASMYIEGTCGMIRK